MKKIILMRHSIPERQNLPTEQLPLSEAGKKLILSRKDNFCNINKCFSSPYLRAIETAQLLSTSVEIIDDFKERIIGIAKEDFWYRQYTDYNFKNEDGESLNDVKKRLTHAMEEVLSKIRDGETALVVSHATAICSYLLHYCEIEVTDATTKSRRITFHEQELLNGIFNPADYFILEFSNDTLQKITFSVRKFQHENVISP